MPPPPRLLAGGEHHPPPTSPTSPEHPFLSAHLLLPSPSPSDLSSAHLPHALAFSFLTHPSSSPPPGHRLLLLLLHAAGGRFPAFYPAFASALLSLPFPLLLPHPRARLLLAAAELTRAAAPGFPHLLASLLRRVPFHGDARLLDLLRERSSFLATEEPQLLASAVFAFLRLLARNRLSPVPRSAECRDCEECKEAQNLEECREKLVSFCVSVLQDHFQVCALIIGRDLVRSLHELVLGVHGTVERIVVRPRSGHQSGLHAGLVHRRGHLVGDADAAALLDEECEVGEPEEVPAAVCEEALDGAWRRGEDTRHRSVHMLRVPPEERGYTVQHHCPLGDHWLVADELRQGLRPGECEVGAVLRLVVFRRE